jgi:7-carboxy-7-deazaguanine synthase
MNKPGYVAELFPSIQGEGLGIGRPQLFLRLAGCSYQCAECDTAWAQQYDLKHASVYCLPVTKQPTKLANPFPAGDLCHLIEKLWIKLGPFQALAITGGEPLEQPGFLLSLLKCLEKNELTIKIMLETNGVHPESLIHVLPYIDSISMDIKLKSTTGINMPLKKHRQFLELIKNSDAYIKAVITSATTSREIITVAKMVNSIAPNLELVIQPMMKKNTKHHLPISIAHNLMKVAMGYHEHVRVIPQMHKFLGIA